MRKRTARYLWWAVVTLSSYCYGPTVEARPAERRPSVSDPHGSAEARAAFTLPPIIISRQTTYITEPLTPDGLPDYAAWLNRKYGDGVTPENNAAVPLLGLMPESCPPETLVQMGLDPRQPIASPRWVGGPFRRPTQIPELRRILESRLASEPSRPAGLAEIPADLAQAFTDQWQRAQSGPWVESDCPLIAVWLDANAGALELVGTAASRSRHWIPVQGRLGSGRLPSLLHYREIATALRMRALLHAGSDRRGRAAVDLLTGMRLGRLLGQGAGLLDRLVGIAVSGTLLGALPAVIGERGTDLHDLRGLLDGLQDLPVAYLPEQAFDEAERLRSLDAVVELYSAAARGQMKERLRELVSPHGRFPEALYRVPAEAIDWNEALRILNRVVDGQDVLETYDDGDAWAVAVGPWIETAEHDPGARRNLTRALLAVPAYFDGLGGWGPVFGAGTRSGRAQVSWNEVEVQFRLAIAATAATLQRAESGAYPRSVEQLQARLPRSSPPIEGERDGYVVRFHGAGDGARFAVTAVPKIRGESGWRSFCVDDGSVLQEYSEAGELKVDAGGCSAKPTPTPRPAKPSVSAGGVASRVPQLLIATLAAVGAVVAAGLLLFLVQRRKRSPLGWKRPLGALTLWGLLAVTTLLGSWRVMKEAMPSDTLVIVTLLADLLAVTLACFIWRGALWAWRVLVLLCPVPAGLAIAWGTHDYVRDPLARPLTISMTVGLLTMALFALSVLLHRDVVADFRPRRVEERDSSLMSESIWERWISIRSWSRLIGAFTFVIALNLVVLLATTFLEAAADAWVEPPPPVLWVVLAASLAAILTSFSLWRGAEWARRALFAGCAGVLVLAAVGGYALVIPEGLASFVARMGLAALMLWAPLFVLTVVGHADVAGGFAQTRRMVSDGALPPRLFVRLMPTVLVVVGALLLLWGTQRSRCAAEGRRLGERAAHVRGEVQVAEVTARKLQEFQREVTLAEARLEALREIVPASLEVRGFMERLERLAREGGIVIESWTGSRVESTDFESAEIELRLRGTSVARDRFARSVEHLKRLAVWRARQADSAGVAATITIYAMAEPTPEPLPRRRAWTASGVWLWPYTAALRSQQEELSRLTRRLMELEVIRAQIDELERRRRSIDILASLIDRLETDRTTAKTAAPRPGP